MTVKPYGFVSAQRFTAHHTLDDAIDQVVPRIVNVAAITAVDCSQFTDGQMVVARGRSAVGDGGGGVFTYSATSTATVDGGIVIAPSAGAGRLLRDGYTALGFNGPVQLQWWGTVDLTGVADSRAVLIAARDYMKAQTIKNPIELPAGTIGLSDTFECENDGLVYSGKGAGIPKEISAEIPDMVASGMTTLKPTASFSTDGRPLMRLRPKTGANTVSRQRLAGGVRGVTFDCNDKSSGLEILSCMGAIFNDLFAARCKATTGYGYSLGVTSDYLGTDLGGCTRNKFDRVNSFNGRMVLWGDTYLGSNANLLQFYSCHQRGNGNAGWDVGNSDSCMFFGCGGKMTLHADDSCDKDIRQPGVYRASRAHIITGWQGGVTAKATVTGTVSTYRCVILGFTDENGATLTIEPSTGSGKPAAALTVLVDRHTKGSGTGDVTTDSGHLFGLSPTGAFLSKSTQSIAKTTWVNIGWSAADFNTHAAWDKDTDSTAIVIPAGISCASLQASVEWASAGTATVRTIKFLKNGADFPGTSIVTLGNSSGNLAQISLPLIKVQPGDVFQLAAYHDQASGPLQILSSNSSWLNLRLT